MDLLLTEIKELKKMILDQSLLRKEVLNFSETCQYLDISESHLYKLTSRKQIPHFCPQGKKLYFNRHELDQWLQQNRQSTTDEIEKEAADYIIKNRRK
jgi:excisionase family DNA binding protein